MNQHASQDVHNLKRVVNRLAQWAEDVSEEAFLDNRMMHAAVARKLVLIGDICERLKNDQPRVTTVFPEIDEWIDLGAALTSVPVTENAEELWAVIVDKLPLAVDRVRVLEPDVL